MKHIALMKTILLILIMVSVQTMAADPSGAKAGFAEIIITPQTVGNGGYCSAYKSKGIHDDLYACAAWFEKGDKQALVISFDLSSLRGSLSQTLRDALTKTHNLKPESIFFTCTHTHNGTRNINADYIKLLTDKVTQVTADARAAAQEFDLGINFRIVDENQHRPFFLQDGTHLYTPNYKMLFPITTGHTDKQLYALFFFDKKEVNKGPCYRQPYAVMVNYTVHPVITGHTLFISADFPGVLRKEIRESLGCPSVYITGAAGDNHPKNPESGFAEAERVGKTLATQVIGMRFDADFIPNSEINIKSLAKTMAAKSASQEDLDAIPQKIHDDLQDWGFPLKAKEVQDIEIGYSVLAVGPVCFFGVPGEWDSELGSALKWFSPFKRNLIMYNSTHPGGGYFMHPNLYKWGGKEAYRPPMSPKYIRPLFNKMIDAAEELYNK